MLHPTLQSGLDDIDLELRGGRVDGFDNGVLACERSSQGRDVLEVSGLDGDRGGEGLGVVVDGMGSASADGYCEACRDERINDRVADVARCLDYVVSIVHDIFLISDTTSSRRTRLLPGQSLSGSLSFWGYVTEARDSSEGYAHGGERT
jgi:hypothetical protein